MTPEDEGAVARVDRHDDFPPEYICPDCEAINVFWGDGPTPTCHSCGWIPPSRVDRPLTVGGDP